MSAGPQLADFGLARQLDLASKIDTCSCGTITHTAPELMDEGCLTKAVVRSWYFKLIYILYV